MPRPRTENPDMIIAEADGSFLFWMNGAFSGDDKRLVDNVRYAAQAHSEMNLTAHGPVIEADDFDAIGAAGALLAAMPGRVKILSAPSRVLDLYPTDFNDDEEIETLLDGEQVGDATVRDTNV